MSRPKRVLRILLILGVWEKVGTSVRIEEDLLKRLDQIAEKRYGSNRSAAIEAAVEQFVESTPRCPPASRSVISLISKQTFTISSAPY